MSHSGMNPTPYEGISQETATSMTIRGTVNEINDQVQRMANLKHRMEGVMGTLGLHDNSEGVNAVDIPPPSPLLNSALSTILKELIHNNADLEQMIDRLGNETS